MGTSLSILFNDGSAAHSFSYPFFFGVYRKKMENMRREKSHDISTSGICPGVLFMAHAEVGWLQNSCMNFLGPSGPQMLAGAAGSA